VPGRGGRGADPSAAGPRMTELRRSSILVVEGAAGLRETLVRALEEEGCRVLAAASGESAVDILWRHRERIDWLFTAVRLPGAVDGWRVAEEYRFSHPFRPVVYAAAQAPESGRVVPGGLYLPIPYRIADVAAAFRRLSAGSGEPPGTEAGRLAAGAGPFRGTRH
jgi:two-component system, OmpR family, response regulator